jgi:hypothetical protein
MDTIGWEVWVIVLIGVCAILGILALLSAKKNFEDLE